MDSFQAVGKLKSYKWQIAAMSKVNDVFAAAGPNVDIKLQNYKVTIDM